MPEQNLSPTGGARVLLVMNEKGGEGKTTIAVGLASTAARIMAGRAKTTNAITDRRPVLLISADPQMSAYTWSQRAEQQTGQRRYDYVQTSDPAELKDLIVEAKTQRRTVIIDSAGTLGFGAETLLSVALDLCTDALIVAQPAGLSLDPTARSAYAAYDRDRPFRICLNMCDPRDADLREFTGWVEEQGWPLCSTTIRKYKLIARSPILGMTVADLPDNTISGKIKVDMADLAAELNIAGAAEVLDR